MDYTEQLKDERWLRKAEVIKKRDIVCQSCGTSKNLNVHHIIYMRELLAWQYPNEMLITLCNKCHIDEHKYQELIDKHIKEMRLSGLLSKEIYRFIAK